MAFLPLQTLHMRNKMIYGVKMIPLRSFVVKLFAGYHSGAHGCLLPQPV